MANNAHGLHSPFLFNIYNQVIKNKSKSQDQALRKIRNQILEHSKGTFKITNPKTGKLELIDLSTFSKKSASSHRFSTFLINLTNYLNFERILETGTCVGINSAYLAQSHAKEIWTIEGSPELAKLSKQHFDTLGISNVIIKTGSVQNIFRDTLVESQPDLIFLDADHRYETIDFYFETIHEHHPKVSCIIIHDIHWSKDMESAWEKIVANPQYNLTLDIFQAGIVFPRYPMEKQHFTMKF